MAGPSKDGFGMFREHLGPAKGEDPVNKRPPGKIPPLPLTGNLLEFGERQRLAGWQIGRAQRVQVSSHAVSLKKKTWVARRAVTQKAEPSVAS